MKYIYISALLLLLFPLSVSAVLVDGYCFLENQTVHDSIQIVFQADSPSAVTDTAYTDINGYYSTDVQTGIYDITYSHRYYISGYLLDQFFVSNITLPNVTLQYGTLISGYIEGILEGTLYYVTGDITVNIGDSLIIEPGATFLFQGNYYFDILGYIYAVGTELDSINFISMAGYPAWNGILFSMVSDANSIMKYCTIAGSDGSGLCLNYAQTTIENCLIKGNTVGSSDAGGLIIGGDSSPVIRDCKIIDNSSVYGGGISCNNLSHSLFENCIIEDNHVTFDGGAANIEDSAHPQFKNCVFRNNGPNGGVRIRENASAAFTNCVIDSNWDTGSDGYGIKCLNNASVTLVNTVVQGNSYYGVNFAGTGTHSITFSDFYRNGYGNFGGNVPPFLGQLVTTNFNGDSCDIYYNIYQDPLFVDPVNGNYNLQAGSPCIDAGDPNSPLDPDGTIADIGAFYFDQSSLAIQDVIITVQGNDIHLQWSPVPIAVNYKIYASENPYFTPAPELLIGTSTAPEFTHQNIVPEGQCFYRIVYEY